MNKKYIVFGLMGLFVMAFAAAAVVTYYASFEQDIIVESPLLLTTIGFDVIQPSDFSVHIADFTLENRANVSVNTIVETSIKGNSTESRFNANAIGEEFAILDIGLIISGVESDIACQNVTGDYYEDGYCFWNANRDRSFTGVMNGVYYVQMGDGNVPLEPLQTMEGRMKLQFSTEIEPATYTFVTQAVTLGAAKDLA